MKRMRLALKARLKWLPQAPRWTARLLGALIAVDSAHLAWQMQVEAHPRADPLAPHASLAQVAALDSRRIADAHLFGVDPTAARGGAAAETRRQLALSGVIATSDANEGYAILGEAGQATRLYHTGAALTSLGAGTLYQVFADHVVLDFDGRQETLSLPRQHLTAVAPVRVARLDAPAAPAAPAGDVPAVPGLYSQREEPPSAAEGWFTHLNVRGYMDGGRTGLQLHPAKRFQRRYGLRDGDTLTAVNGVPVADEDALDNLLRVAGKTVALTLSHDGVEETRRFPVDQ
jgi:type II secretion system protein C